MGSQKSEIGFWESKARDRRWCELVVVQISGFIGSFRCYPHSTHSTRSTHSDVAAELVSDDLYRRLQPRRRRYSGPSAPQLAARTVSTSFVGLQSGSDRVSEECGVMDFSRVVRAHLGQRPAWRSDEISLAAQVGIRTD